MNNRSRTIAALCCCLAAGGPGVAGNANGVLCEVIAEYDARPDTPAFTDQFLHMAFGNEHCAKAGAGCRSGELVRRDRGVSLVLAQFPSTADHPEKLATIGTAMDYAIEFIGEATGLDDEGGIEVVEAGETTPSHPPVFTVIGSREELRNAGRILGKDGGNMNARIMVDAALDIDLPCWALRSVDGPQASAAPAYVFIDIGAPKEVLAQCAKEELFNVFLGNDPIGDASLFDDDWRRDDHDDPGVGSAFSDRDRALLKTLYLPDLRAGMTEAEARAELEDFKQAHCNRTP